MSARRKNTARGAQGHVGSSLRLDPKVLGFDAAGGTGASGVPSGTGGTSVDSDPDAVAAAEGAFLFGRTDTVGLRFDDDKTWRFLVVGSDGGVVAGQGFDNFGAWSVLDTSSFNGPGFFQVNLDITGVGGNGVFPTFASEPAKMRLSTMLGPADYALLDER